MEVWIIWLTAAALLLTIEVLTQMMWALCLTIGAAGAMVCALCGLDLKWQVAAMAVLGIVAYIVLLPEIGRAHV